VVERALPHITGARREWALKQWLADRAGDKLPLLVLAAGAGALFAANVFARKTFTDVQFVSWAYLTTLVAFFFSFSLLGSEQLLVRTARGTGGRLELPVQSARYIGLSFVVFALLYLLVLDGQMLKYQLGPSAIPILVSVGAFQVVYQLERAGGHLVAAQLAMNGWKLILLPSVGLVGVATPGQRAEISIAAALAGGMLLTGALFQRARARTALVRSPTDADRVYLPFMFSLGVMSVLGIADRALLERLHDPETFAAYVYLVTILVSPFNILASYFGFREAVRYRRAYSRAAARVDALRTMGLASVLVLGWSVLCYGTRNITGLTFDLSMWGGLGAIAVVRCGYGVLSAALAVRGTPGAMYGINALTAGALVVFAALLLSVRAPVVAIIAGYVLVWCIRFLASFLLLGSASFDAERRAESVSAV
jgi:hypothetical protein